MVADGLVLVDVANGVGEHRSDGQHLDFGARLLLRNGVREDDFRQFGFFDVFVSLSGQDRMGGHGADAGRSFVGEHVGCLANGAGGVNHVVHHDDVLALHVADDFHVGDLVGPDAGLVADDEAGVEVLGP